MGLRDGHGRTPHDGLETFLSGAAMLCCLPCLCVVAVGKLIPKKAERSSAVDGAKQEEKTSENKMEAEEEKNENKTEITLRTLSK